MEETLSQTQDQWSYGLLKDGACVTPKIVGSSLEIGDEEGVLIRVQGLQINLFVHGEPINLAPYLVNTPLNIAGTIPVREYEGWIAGYRIGIYCLNADIDIDLIEPDGAVWRGLCSYQAEWE